MRSDGKSAKSRGNLVKMIMPEERRTVIYKSKSINRSRVISFEIFSPVSLLILSSIHLPHSPILFGQLTCIQIQ